MAFPTNWTTEIAQGGLPVYNMTNRGRAFLQIGSTTPNVDTNDVSPPIRLNASNSSLEIVTDSSGGTAGLFTCDVKVVVDESGANVGSVIVAQLSAGTPAVYNLPPGQYIVVCTASADTAGEIQIRGRNE